MDFKSLSAVARGEKTMTQCWNCAHSLDSHVKEEDHSGDLFRCHSIMTKDLLQCECRIYGQDNFQFGFEEKCLSIQMGMELRKSEKP